MGVFAYQDPDTNATVYHVVPSPKSEYAPSSFDSETDSTASWTTIQSDQLPGYFVLHHGRQQPASDNIAKWLPSDNIQRHILIYLKNKSVLGCDYADPVKRILGAPDGREKRALELGTKTGIWIQAVASQFPNVHFRSLDVAPVTPHAPCHNVTFEVYDYTQGIQLADGSQDVVFMNSILHLVKNYRAILREVHRVLRPGGLIHIIEHGTSLWDLDDNSKLARVSTPIQYFYDLVDSHLAGLGIDSETCSKLPQWLAPGSNLWDSNQTGFNEVHTTMNTFPVYPHDGLRCIDWVGPAMAPYFRRGTELCVRDTYGLALDFGLQSDEAQKMLDQVIEDLRQHENCALIKSYCIYATKI